MIIAVTAFIVAILGIAWGGLMALGGAMSSAPTHDIWMFLVTLPLPLIAVVLGALLVYRAVTGDARAWEGIASLPGLVLGLLGLGLACLWHFGNPAIPTPSEGRPRGSHYGLQEGVFRHMILAAAAFAVAFVGLVWSGLVAFAGSMGGGSGYALRMLLMTLPLPLLAIGLGIFPVCRAITGGGKIGEAVACIPGLLLGVLGLCQAFSWYLGSRGNSNF
jgi:hypothetical protein